MHYFRKEILSNRIVLKTRNPQWESVGNDEGILATDSDELVAELGVMADVGRGGVIRITAEEYEELKKKPASPSPQRPRLGDPWQDPSPLRTSIRNLDLPVAGGAKPPPMVTPEGKVVNPGPSLPPDQEGEPIKPPLSFAAAGPKPARPKATKATKSPFEK